MEHIISTLRLLYKHRIKLTLLPVLAMGLLYAITNDQKHEFKSEAKLYLNIHDTKETSLTEESLKQFQISTQFQNLSELLKSEATLQRVQLRIFKSILEEEYIWKDAIDTLPQVKMIVRLDTLIASNHYLMKNHPIDKKINHLNEVVSLETLSEMILSFRILDSHFLKLELTAEHPLMAQQLLSFFIQSVEAEFVRISKNKVTNQKDVLAQLVKEAKENLDEKLRALEDFKISNQVINLPEHTKAIVVYLVTLEGQRHDLLSKIAAADKGKIEILNTAKNGNAMALDLTMQNDILSIKNELKAQKSAQIREKLQNNQIDITQIQEYNDPDVTRNQLESKLKELATRNSYDPSKMQMELANQYLAYDLAGETGRDMLKIINKEIDRVTNYSVKFAPVESSIGSLEREISVAQNAYLTLLNKLNMTSSIELGSGTNELEIIDSPTYDPKPLPSKRIILVAGSGVAVFTMIAGLLIIFHLLNAAITNVKQLERVSRFKVTAAMPSLKNIKNKDEKRATEIILMQQQILLVNEMEQIRRDGRKVFVICSNQTSEDKAEFALGLKEVLENGNQTVGLIDADWLTGGENEKMINIHKLVKDGSIHFNREEVKKEVYRISHEFDWVFVIIPSLNISTDYHIWFELTGRLIHLFQAGRVRNHADERFEEYISKLHLDFHALVMNEINIEEMETYLGEIPKSTGGMSGSIQKLINRDVNNGNA